MAKKKSFDRLREAVAAAGPRVPNFQVFTPAKKPDEAWHIAVRGNIDIRQHHPLWYKMIGCITDAELAAGMRSFTSVAVPFAQGSFLQFDVGPFAINVIPDRWMIQTVTEANCDLITDVASTVFRKLNEITVTAYGINKSIVLELPNQTANQFLADQLIQSKLMLPNGNADANFFFCHKGEIDTQIWFHPSPAGEKWLHVEHNRHHPVTHPSGKYVDVGALFKENTKRDWAIAVDYGQRLAKSVEV